VSSVWTDGTRARLESFLSRHGLMDGAPDISPIGDGHSNLTFLLRRGEMRLVLRRPPRPPLAPGSNDVLREARVLAALAPTGLPVPPVLAVGHAGEIFDVPFFIMTHVPGVVITDHPPDALSTPEDARAMGLALVDTLADLHAVDWRAGGLDGYGRPEGFNLRHLRRISSLVREADGAVAADFARLYDWLEQSVPPEAGATIIHNDFRIGNVMWAAEPPARLLAILDWELATLGDPLFDLAYLLASIPQPGEAPTPTQAMALATLQPNFPARDELAGRYAVRAGRGVERLGWYTAMVNWKLAALYAYSKRRGLDPYYDAPDQVSRFLEEARRFAAPNR